MAPKLLPVRRRLSKKTTVKPAPKRKQKPLPQPLIIDPADEKSDAKRHVYLVTFPHPKATHSSCGVLLVSPESKTKEEMGKCLWDACLSPIHATIWSCISLVVFAFGLLVGRQILRHAVCEEAAREP